MPPASRPADRRSMPRARQARTAAGKGDASRRGNDMTRAMDRPLFAADHDTFRQAFRQFIDREIRPHQERWRGQGQVDREIWRKAGSQGFLCPWMEEKYGGAGGEFLHSVIVME